MVSVTFLLKKSIIEPTDGSMSKWFFCEIQNTLVEDSAGFCWVWVGTHPPILNIIIRGFLKSVG